MYRIFKLSITAVLLITITLLYSVNKVYTQDPLTTPDSTDIILSESGVSNRVWQVSKSGDGYTTWHQDINSGCLYNDHNYILDIPADPSDMSDISYTMNNYDVDYNDPKSCAGGPEVDHMMFNGHFLGILTGANDSWSLNSWTLNQSQIKSGANQIYIDTDAPGTGCWCVGVGYIEVKAKLDFNVKTHTPQKDDKNRDFHADKLDLTVTFSDAYDTATLNNNTFKLEYRNQSGGWQQVAGSFTQLNPEQFRFVPNADLKDGIRYRATIVSGANGVKSQVGVESNSDTVWYFWTIPNLDITDNFNYGSASKCPPSVSPCPGLEIAVFQVARNATMVPNKDAVTRLYVRWKQHTDVHVNDQVKEMELNTSMSVDGKTYNKKQKVKRPDHYTVANIQSANNTINFYHTPVSNFNYTAKVIPHPQTNTTPVEYSQTQNLASSGKSPTITFDYYFLKDGNWAGGVPANAKTTGVNLMTVGTQYTTDQFPTLGTNFNQKGEYTIGYTFTGNTINYGSCGIVQEVACPSFFGLFSRNKKEISCVYEKLETLRGGILGIGADKFVAATVPNTLCIGATAFAMENKVIMHQFGNGANDGTIAHEVGHIYGISTANNPNNGHRNPSNGVEGFQVRTKTNRSFVENPTQVISLMHQNWQPAGLKWIDNDDYATLLNTVPRLSNLKVISASTYLIISGYVNTNTNTVDLLPAYLKEVPNDPPSATGICTIELLDVADTVLSSDNVNPGIEIHFLRKADNQSNQSSTSNIGSHQLSDDEQYFTVSLPWDDTAQKIRISCGGTILLTQDRSPNLPTVDFNNLTNNATLSGTQTLSWTGNDADGPGLAYQLQFSNDNGINWTPLMPLGPNTSFDLNTTFLASGNNMQLRVMVTDGFNTTYVTRTINIINSLAIAGVLPADNAIDIGLNSPIQAFFVTNVATSSLTNTSFVLLENGFTEVEGTISYNKYSRAVIFTPHEPLKANTNYTARLTPTIQDVNNNNLGSTYEWRFTTVPDTIPPQIIHSSPPYIQTEVPLNTLIQVQFNEPMEASTLTTNTFQLFDEVNNPVVGTVTYNTTDYKLLFIPTANLAPNSTYKAQVSTGVSDIAGNLAENSYEWSFTTGSITTSNGLRIIGNYNDQATDIDGDNFYDRLTLFVDVEVLDADTYNLNGRLLDKSATLIDWQTTGNIYLSQGIHTLQLHFNSASIRNNGVDGSYLLDALNFYKTNNLTHYISEFKAYNTFPYDVTKFYSTLVMSELPDQTLAWNTSLDNAFNLRDYTTHTTLPITNVTYSIFINTNPTINVSIDADDNIDIDPMASTTITEGDVTVQAKDSLNNQVWYTFHITVQGPATNIYLPIILKNGTSSSQRDTYEPDDTSAQAKPIISGVSQIHSIVPVGDVDWVIFSLNTESGVILETSGSDGDTRMWLYDGSLNSIEFDDDDGNGLFSYIDRTCGFDSLPIGTYYIGIDEYSNSDEIPYYNISLTANSCP